MAVEAKRGCGFRKVGGLYLVGEPGGFRCDRLPIPLLMCPTCGGGIKPSRGWTWVFPYNLLEGNHVPCSCKPQCPVCYPMKMGKKAGLLWVGSSFYTPEQFVREANELGVSKRIPTLPKGLKLGRTWVLLGHRQVAPIKDQRGLFEVEELGPGIFFAFVPKRVEKIITESQAKDEEMMRRLQLRGITPVIVPDDDPDHQ